MRHRDPNTPGDPRRMELPGRAAEADGDHVAGWDESWENVVCRSCVAA